ncbi:MAG: M20/M25/M40 family metallo-hydrolase [Anaerolineales bacterium]
MTDLKPFLKSLISGSGLSGHETPIRRVIEAAWRPLTDELRFSRMGNLYGLRRANRPQKDQSPNMLFAAHMDAIGMMVTGVVDGFLRLTNVGGLDARILPGQLVTVHGRQELIGVVVLPPAHLLPEGASDSALNLDYLLVDVGLAPDELPSLVGVGDLVSFAQDPVDMGADLLAGHSLDNRASVAALTACLQHLQGRRLEWDLWAVASVQEEENLRGAGTAAYELHPDLAVAIDVTFAKGPGSPGHSTFPLAKGLTLGWGPNIHPALYKTFEEVAERLEIPYQLEPMPRSSGTDAMRMQTAGEGIPTMVVSIPLRYMHTPVEIVSMQDIERAGRLLAEYAATLPPDDLDQLTWDVDG